jgi:hypothetical protein
MGSRLLEFEIGAEAGPTVLVEVQDDGRDVAPIGRDTVAEQAKKTFTEAVARLRPAIEAVMGQLRDLAEQPDGISVEFGIKLTAAADAVIAKTAVEGNLKVVMSWNRKPET